MSLLGQIFGKIFHSANPVSDAQAAPASGASPTSSTTGSTSPSAAGAAPSGAGVDVGAVLSEMASKSGQQLNWKTSIVDLLKLLNLDSSMTARKQLADELHYTGDKDDSASMNIWLHKQVVQKMAENGGRVPDDMKHA